MKRTNIHLRDDQRTAMVAIATERQTKPAEEYREAVDNHIAAHPPIFAAHKPRKARAK